MRKLIQLFSLILLAGISCWQINAQTTSDNSAKVRAENDSGSSVNAADRKLLDSMVQIKGQWELQSDNFKPVYVLFVSAAQLAKAGVKVQSKEKAVPVYVKTENEYEPVLVEDRGQYNHPVVGNISGSGFFVSRDGFILTTRRLVAPWISPFEMNAMPPGILMSADLKQILQTDVPPPTKWIPAKTKKRSGTLGKLNMSVNSPGEYRGNLRQHTVNTLKNSTSFEAHSVASVGQEVGILKITHPGDLPFLELFSNSETFKKGVQNIFIVHQPFSEKAPLPSSKELLLAKTMTSVADIRQTEETGDVALLANSFTDSGNSSNLATTAQTHFAAFAAGYSGSPVLDGEGRVIGIYLSYDRKTDLHSIVPIHSAKQFLGIR